MKNLRLSAILPFAFATISLSLTIVFLLGGNGSSTTNNQYMVFLNSSNIGQNLIRFERATSTANSPSATASSATTTSNPLDPLNPFSTANPLNPNNPNNPFNPDNTNSPLSNLSSLFDPLVANLTDTVNGGIENAINDVVGQLIKTAGIRDAYYLYSGQLCEGDVTTGNDRNKDGIKIDECNSYDDAALGLRSLLSNDIQSSLIIGQTNISVPIVGAISHALGTISSGISVLRKVLFAFLIISLVGSALSTLSSLAAIFLPRAQLLVYMALIFASIEAITSVLAALILTVLIVGVVAAVDGLGNAVSLYIKQGNTALVFIWLRCLFIIMVAVYWLAIWFVEVRTISFTKRARTEEEVGNWKGVMKEMKRDLEGRKDETRGYRKDLEWSTERNL